MSSTASPQGGDSSSPVIALTHAAYMEAELLRSIAKDLLRGANVTEHTQSIVKSLARSAERLERAAMRTEAPTREQQTQMEIEVDRE